DVPLLGQGALQVADVPGLAAHCQPAGLVQPAHQRLLALPGDNAPYALADDLGLIFADGHTVGFVGVGPTTTRPLALTSGVTLGAGDALHHVLDFVAGNVGIDAGLHPAAGCAQVD